MVQILYLSSRVTAAVVGLIAFYVAAFLREDQEGKLQDRIERLWISIDDRDKTSRSRATIVVNSVADAINTLYDRLFGRQLVSPQVVGVSTSLAFAAFFFGWAYVFYLILRLLHAVPQLPSFMAANTLPIIQGVITVAFVIGLAAFLCGVLPSMHPGRVSTAFSLAPILGFTLFSVAMGRHTVSRTYHLTMSVSIVLSTLSDVLAIVVVRNLTKWISVSGRPFRIFLAISGQLGLVFVLFAGPLLLTAFIHPMKWPLLSDFLFPFVAFNFFTALIGSMLSIALVTLLVHRLFWPIISILIYQLQRYKIVHNHKAMVRIASGCVIYAVPSIIGVVHAVAAWILLIVLGNGGSSTRHVPSNGKG